MMQDLLKKGETRDEQSIIPSFGTTIGAYGSGALPEIDVPRVSAGGNVAHESSRKGLYLATWFWLSRVGFNRS